MNLIEQVESLNFENKRKVLKMAINSQTNKNELSAIYTHCSGRLMQRALNTDMTSIEGRADFTQFATEVLGNTFQHLTSERISEEIKFFRSNSRLNYSKLNAEFYQIYTHYNKTK